MPLQILGTEPKQIFLKENEVSKEALIVKYGHTVDTAVAVWGKQFKLTCTKVASSIEPVITVNRTSSPNEHASTGELSSGDTIYYGDVLSIQVTPKQYPTSYCVDPYTVNGVGYLSRETVTTTVDGDVSVRAGTKRYDEPQITCVVETTGIYNNKYTITITNPNNVDCTVEYDVYGSGQYLLLSDYDQIPAKSTITITGSNTWYKSGMLIEAALTDDYYGSEFASLSVNNYESSTGETTTT